MPRLYPQKVGKKTYWYVVDYVQVNGRSHRKPLKSLGPISKRDAEFELAKYTLQQPLSSKRGHFIDVLNEFEGWYNGQIGHAIEEGTYQNWFWYTKQSHRFFDGKHIRDIHEPEIDDYKLWVKDTKKWGNRTINISLSELRKVFIFAKRRGYIARIPEFERLPEGIKRPPVSVPLADIRRAIEKATPELCLYIQFMGLTGLRPKEFDSLTWDHISIEHRIITIISKNRLKRGRTIGFDDQLLSLLKEWPRHSDNRLSFWKTESGPTRALRKLSLQTGIPLYRKIFRSTFATEMIRAKQPPVHLAQMLGHSKMETTYARYVAELGVETSRELMSAIPSLINGKR